MGSSAARPIKLGKLREGLAVIPFADIFNLFNHSSAGPYSGLDATYGSLNFDYAKGAASGQGPSDMNVTRGRQNYTRRVMIGGKGAGYIRHLRHTC